MRCPFLVFAVLIQRALVWTILLIALIHVQACRRLPFRAASNCMHCHTSGLSLCLVLLVSSFATLAGRAQSAADSLQGIQLAGLPVLGYNSDEGLNYGARLSVFHHGHGGYSPYWFVIEGQLLATQAGRVDGFLFFDAPHLLPHQQRLTAQVAYHEYNQAPFYGVGNGTRFDESVITEDNAQFIQEGYYQYERTRFAASFTYQRPLGPLQGVAGLGITHTIVETSKRPSIFDTPFGRHTPGLAGGFTNFLKLGLSYDTRDFEPAPTQGFWTDVVGEFVSPLLGSDYTYTRFTLTHRSYHQLRPGLVFAERILAEHTVGTMPFFEMAYHGGSFRGFEALGGSKSLRGHAQNRFSGPSKLMVNAELRWRYWDFSLLRQALFGAASLFVDTGRVFAPEAAYRVASDTFADFHTAYGMGLHGGWNETFIVTLNIGRSSEIERAIYMSIGYLF